MTYRKGVWGLRSSWSRLSCVLSGHRETVSVLMFECCEVNARRSSSCSTILARFLGLAQGLSDPEHLELVSSKAGWSTDRQNLEHSRSRGLCPRLQGQRLSSPVLVGSSQQPKICQNSTSILICRPSPETCTHARSIRGANFPREFVSEDDFH